jgi:anti-anti-sigma regulatory factor
MITEQRDDDKVAFTLTGALAGDWAAEFSQCWQSAVSSPRASQVTVDLTEVTFIDERGKQLLGSMMMQGARLIARDIFMQSVVEEIAKSLPQREPHKTR